MTVRRITRWAAVSLATISVGLAGVAAAAGNRGTEKPGKGCGDRYHVHYKEAQCKGDGPGDGHHHGEGHHRGHERRR